MDEQKLVLGVEASKRFVEELLYPSAPNEAMKKAVKKYLKLGGKIKHS